jgi:glutamate/tyrosine decarboxylase-like PLP-dependent enzyme
MKFDDKALNAAAAHAVGFRQSAESRLHRPEKSYAEMRKAFAGDLPEKGSDGAAVIEELVELAVPGLGASTGARFFGWVIGGSHPLGVAADWLTSAWGQNGSAVSPAAAACEETAARWLLDLLKLPSEASIGFVTGATMANFTCLAAARGEVLRRVGWDVEAEGLFGAPPIRVVIGDEAHASVFSALQYLGLGQDRVVRVSSDVMGRMRHHEFEDAMRASQGPTIVIIQAGHLNTGAFDPIDEIIATSRRCGAWVHVDGAFGLWARACPETAPLAQGYEAADSWAVDGHKWLQTPYDCGYAIVRDTHAHRRAMTINASYLARVAQDERNPSHLVPELSRRARGFATWAMIRALGREGIAQMIARHCRLARRMAAALTAEPGVEILNEVVLNQLAVRFGAKEPIERGDAMTRAVIERVQQDGVCFAGGAQHKGQWIMRISVISWYTSDKDIDISAAAIINAWRGVKSQPVAPI